MKLSNNTSKNTKLIEEYTGYIDFQKIETYTTRKTIYSIIKTRVLDYLELVFWGSSWL